MQKENITKSAFSFLTGTFLSRIMGFVRDFSMAYCFGTEASIAAFLVAYRFSSLLRRLFGEGALLNGFVPQFESYRKENNEKAVLFFRDLFGLITVILCFLIIFLEGMLWAGKSFIPFSESNQEIILLTMYMLPGLLFICLYSLFCGVMHCQKKFFLTGFAPIGFNIIWILTVWIIRDYPAKEGVIILSQALSLAFFVQWMFVVPSVLHYCKKVIPFYDFFKFNIFSKELYTLLWSISLTILGVAAGQINSALDILFARYASLEGPAYLSFAIHLQQLPLALFGISIASACLPALSRAFQSKDLVSFEHIIQSSLSKVTLILFPCTIGIEVLGKSAINFLYGHGEFTPESVIQTSKCLEGYGLGLLPMAYVLILTQVFFSQKNYKIPTYCSLAAILVNLLFNALFVCVFHWGPVSLAYSTTLSACFNMGILAKVIEKKEGIKLFPLIFRLHSKTIFSSLIAGVIVLSIPMLNDFFYADSLFSQWIELSFYMVVYMASFTFSSFILKDRDILHLIQLR